MTLALVKSLLLLGAILLVGGGVTAALVAPELTVRARALRRCILWGAAAGAGLLVLGSALDLTLTLVTALGRFPSHDLTVSYLISTRHGHAVLVRTLLVGLVLPLTFWLTRRSSRQPWLTGVYLVASCLLLGTFSYTSHAAATGGTPPFIADLAHFAAATLWAGPLCYLALVPNWDKPYRTSLQLALKRVSFIGLFSVLTLFATGSYTALVHLQDPARFATSPYGFVLCTKLVLVSLIIGLAAFNRFRLLPVFLQSSGQDSSPRFRRVVRTEGVLLVAVLLATGVLTTNAPPHGETQTGAWTNLVNLVHTLQGD